MSDPRSSLALRYAALESTTPSLAFLKPDPDLVQVALRDIALQESLLVPCRQDSSNPLTLSVA